EGLGKNLVPEATDFDIIDKFIKVTDEESAYRTREIALKEGIMGGYTSGAVVQAYKQMNGEFKESDKVVLIFPDHGSRYITKVFSDEWMKEQGFTNSRLNGLESNATVQHVEKLI
ncbi:MAG: pyridoxal-phosphate dependent enzyme, partial [Weeksellaceae bacterium]|nr:pyridoxal-phosphate dependent enzyme [Weeksellaceae bacterium]